MKFGGRLDVRSRGTRWAIARAHDFSPVDTAQRTSGSFAASMVDAWCDDTTSWPEMFALYEELAGSSFRPPMAADVGEWIKPRLRRAFEDGTFIAVDATLLGQAKKSTEEGVHGKPAQVEPPVPPPAPRRPVTPPKTLHSFAIRLVDELGTAISGVDLQFSHGGSQDDGSTDGNGVARVEDSAATSAKAKIVDAKALRKAVKPRWDQVRGDRKWLDESQGVTVVRLVGDRLPSFDLLAEKLRIVSVQPFVARVRLIGGFFDTSKCFVLPRGLDAVRAVVKMYEEFPKAKLLAAGHTDTAGKPAYNDPLSLERAEAVKDYLTDNVDGWYKWYDASQPTEKRWGAKEDNAMIVTLPGASERDPREEPVRWFQRTRGLAVDGIAGTQTRHALIREYMSLDGTSLPKGIEVIPHGCGENFPAKATGEDAPAEENRRVELFFFDGELGVEPPPAGKNSKAGSPRYPEWVKRTKRTDDHVIVAGQAWFQLKRLLDDQPAAGSIAVIELPDGTVIQQKADEKGFIRLDGMTGEKFRLVEIVDDERGLRVASIDTPTPIA